MRRIIKAMKKVSEKIWGGRTSSEILAKRFKIFVLLGIFFIGISKLLYLAGITFPNLELVIPTLVVVGSFSLYCGGTKFWRRMTRYFGVVALISVFLIDLRIWGLRSIYAFTWTGFLLAWSLGMRNKLSLFDKFKTLLGHTMLTAAIAILLFDFWTGIIGWTLTHGISVWMAFIAQIPFTFYHLCSLVFIPPLIGLGKLLVKVKVPVPVAIRAGVGATSSGRR